MFVNGRKIPLIPPILVNDQVVTNFLGKANLFNEFFTQQCNTSENDSTTPNDLVFETTERVSFFDIHKDEITNIIRSLDILNYANIRITLMNELNDINDSITSRQPNELHRIILYGDCKFKGNFNKTDFDCNLPIHQKQ